MTFRGLARHKEQLLFHSLSAEIAHFSDFGNRGFRRGVLHQEMAQKSRGQAVTGQQSVSRGYKGVGFHTEISHLQHRVLPTAHSRLSCVEVLGGGQDPASALARTLTAYIQQRDEGIAAGFVLKESPKFQKNRDRRGSVINLLDIPLSSTFHILILVFQIRNRRGRTQG